MKWALISALILSLTGSFLLMGLPGAVLLEAWQWLASLMGFKLLCLKQDAAWPSAIIMSATWPWSIPLSQLLLSKNFASLKASQAKLLFGFLLVLDSLLLTLILEALSRS